MSSLLDKNLITTREASELSGYHSDYLGRLSREGKISASRVGRSWVIDRSSLLTFVAEQEAQKKKNAEELARSREEEYKAVQAAKAPVAPSEPVAVPMPQTTSVVADAPAREPVYEVPVASVPSPYFSSRELREKMVATLIALLAINIGLFAGEAKIVEHGALVAVKTLENTSDIGTHALAGTFKQGAGRVAAFRIGEQKFGETFISGLDASLSLYKGTILAAGARLASDETIAFADGAGDGFAQSAGNGLAAAFVRVEVAVGSAIIDASHALLAGHEQLAIGFANGSQELPPRLISGFYNAGSEGLAFVGNLPERLARGYENATYAWVDSSQDIAMRVTRAELMVGTNTNVATQKTIAALVQPADSLTGARGALASFFETRVAAPSPSSGLAAASVAGDFFAPARSLALFTYETINGFFDGASRTLAALFPANIAYAPAESFPSASSVTTIIESHPTNTYVTNLITNNPVSYIYSGTGGATIEYVQQAIDNVRRDIARNTGNSGGSTGLADLSGSSIEELADVGAMAKSFGDLLLWNGTEWTNVATSSLGIGAGSGSPGGALGTVQFNAAGLFAGDAAFTFDASIGRLSVNYASTTGISSAYASTTLLRAGNAFIDSLSATLATLTNIVATDSTTTNATTTNLAVMNSFALGSDRFSDLTGAGLTASSGALAVDDVTPSMLQAADFGAFTCNGTSCSLDSSTVSDAQINFGSVTLADFTNDAGFLTSAVTSIGPGGALQSGPAITFATTSTAFNGLTASTTITAAGNTITFANTLSGKLGIAGGGTGTSTAPLYGQLLVGDGTGGYALVATSSLGISGSGGTPGGASGQVQFNNAGVFAGNAAFTFDSATARLSATYASTTGLSASYASSTNLFAGNFTLGALNGILKATSGVVSVATAGVDYLTSAITSIGPAGQGQTGASITLATSTAGTDFTITAAGNAITFNLPSASATARGLLSAGDWSAFNNKISSTSLSATTPLAYNSGTGVFTIQQATTGQNGYLSSTDFNTFNNKISSTSLSATGPLTYNSGTGAFTITQATTGTNGYVSSTDFNTFNNKISSTSLSGGAGISYNSGTGVITNTGVLTTSGDWTGTFDGQEGSFYLARANQTGTQLAATISDFASTARGLFSSSATGLTYTSGTGAFSLTSGYVIPLVASTTQWDTAFSWGNHASAGYENALSFVYPLVRTVNSISLAFGTTTANSWGAQQTFTGIFATNASTTNATTTNLTVNGAFRGAGLTTCSASGDKLLWNASTGQFSCGADAGAGGGITAIGAQYSAFQTGSSQTFATTSDTNLGLIITSTGDTHTFTPTWTGTLAAGRLNSNVVQSVTNDTNITGSISAQNLTLGWTGQLSVTRGGTGWGAIQAGAIPYGAGTGALATTTQGTGGFVLAWLNGVPTWTSTSSISNGLSSIGPAGSLQSGPAVTFATSSTAFNGLTASTTITASGNTITFANTLAGRLGVAGGGTGQATFTSGQLLYGNGTNALSSVATTTFTPSAEFTTTGTIGALIGGSNSTIGLANNGVALTKLAQIAANTILGNSTGSTGNVTAIATSTLFGTGTGGQVLTWNNGVPTFVATTTYSAPLVFASGNVTITQSGTGANGYLSSTDFNTFNNKISSTSLSGASVISYNSSTGVITTTGGTFGSGDYIFPNKVTSPYASSTALSSAYASSTNLFAGNFTLGALNGILKATSGVVSVATAGVDYLTSAITSIGPAGQGQTGASITLATSTAGTDFTITAAGNAITFNLPSASATARGLLTLTDYATFQNKVSSTSLSGGAGISYVSGTGVITNTGVTSNVAGTGINVSGATGAVTISNTGVLSAQQSFGTAQTGALTFATSSNTTSGLTSSLAITNAGGTFTFAPSLSGTLTAAGGGTGQSSYATGDILYADSGTSLARLPVSTNGLVLKLVGGVPSWQPDITTGGGGGAGAWSTTTDSLAIYPSDTSDVIIVGASATTTTNSILEIFGRSYFSNTIGIATTSASSLYKLAVQGNTLLSGNLSVANVTATGTATVGNLTVGSLTGVLKAASGVVSTATAGVDFENPLSFIYPLVRSVDSISLAFGTTTANLWGAQNTFTGIFATNASSTNATTTNLHITSATNGGLATDATGRVYSAATTTAGTGLTYSGNAFNVNTSQNISTLSNLTSNGLIKTSGGTGALSIATPGTDYVAGGAGAATTTYTVSGPFTTSATPVVFGSSPITSTYYGLATTSALTSSHLLVSNGAAGVYGVSTTTASCTGTASCSAFTILGSTPITISGTGLASYDAWTHPSAGVSATTSGLIVSASSTIGNGTVGLTVSGAATTTGRAYFAGNVGIGTTTPTAPLGFSNSVGDKINLFSTTYGFGVYSNELRTFAGTGSSLTYGTQSSSGTFSELARLNATGFGVGTTTFVNQLAIQGNGLFSGNLTSANLTATGTVSFTGLGTGLVKSTAGTLGLAVAGTDYVAGGAGAATTTLSTSGVLSFNANPVVFGSAPISLSITQSGTGASGYLSSTDFNTFNNKISSTSLSGASVISYNSGTGVITTAGGTFGAGNYIFPGSVTAPYASSTAFSSGYASSTNAFFGNLSIANLSGVLRATGGAISTGLVSLASEVSGLLPVGNGGTGWGAFQANTVLLGNGTGAISTTSAGTNGQVLALVSGVPTWVATTSVNNGVASIQQTGGGTAQTGAITFATSSATSNGVTIGLNITNTGGAFTFTPSRSGILSVAGGGTGVNTFTSGQLIYGNGTNALSSVATTTFTPSGEFTTTGTIGAFIGGSNSTLGLATNGVALTKLAQIAANTILGNSTGATGNVTAIATSTLFGTGTGGQVLTWNNGVPSWVATTTYSAPLVFSAGNVTITQSGTGANGYLSSTDFNTFNNKISSTSLSGASVISYNSGTGVITTTGGTFGAGNYVFPGNVTAPYASSTALSSAYASSTNAFFGNLSVGTLSGLLKATAGVVSAATAGTDYENPLSFVYPIVRSVNSISLAFGTTTQNFWSAYNNFSSLFATNASSTNATTTNLHITSASNGGLATDANGRVYSAATTTAGTGLTYSGNAFNVNTSQNISTLSNLTSNGLIKTSGGTGALSIATAGTDYVAGGAGAATTTLTISGPFTTSAMPIVFGSSPITSTYYGLATTSALSSSQLLVSNGAAGVYGVSTTTASCSGTASCSAFTILGSAPITITGGGLATYDAWTHPLTGWSATTSIIRTAGLYSSASSTIGDGTQTGGLTVSGGATTTASLYVGGTVSVGANAAVSGSIRLPNNTGINGRNAANSGDIVLARLASDDTAQFGNGAVNVLTGGGTPTLYVTNNNGSVGIGTSSPYARLSVAGSAAGTTNLFAISTSTAGFATSTAFLVDSSGNVAIGRSSVTAGYALDVAGSTNFRGGIVDLGSNGHRINGSTSNLAIVNASTGTITFQHGNTVDLTIANGGNVGIGSTTPYAKLGVSGFSTGAGIVADALSGFAGNLFDLKLASSTVFAVNQAGTLTTSLASGLVKSTSGVLGLATAGTDYLAGGAGAATTTLSTSGVLSFNANPVVFGASPISLTITQSGTGANGYLSSTDFNTFNNKISSTSLSGASVISYNSGTGVITTTPGTFAGSGTYTFPAGVVAPYASSTAFSAGYASSTNAFFGNLSIGSLTGLLKGTAGAVSAAIAGTDYVAGGAGAATTTLTISGPFTTSATPVVFGSSPITSTYYGLSTTTTLTASGVLYSSNGAAGVASVATSTPTGVDLTISGTGATIGALQINNPYAIATTSGLAVSQIPYYTQTGGRTTIGGVATSTRTYSAEFSNTGTLGYQIGGANAVVSLATNGVALTKLAQIAANTILGNNTGATGNVTAFATSTLFGTGTGGQVLTWNNGVPSWVATTTFSSPLIFSAGNVTIQNAAADGATKGAASFATNDFDASSGNITLDYTNGQKASASVPGFLSSADWSAFNNKISSTSLSGASVISYNSGTGVITTSPGTFAGSGTYTFPAGVVVPYASTTVITSSGSAYFGTTVGSVGIGTTTLPAKLSIDTADAAAIGLSIRGFPSQTAVLQEWRSSDNTLAGRFRLNNTTGGLLELYQSGVITTGVDGSNGRIWAGTTAALSGSAPGASSAATLTVATAAGRPGALFRGASGQTAALTEWQNVSGTALSIVDAFGNFGIGTTTPQWALTLSSSTKSQLTLTDGSATAAPFNFRAINNSLYFSTSSPTTFATTTSSFLSFNSTTGSTTLQKLDISGNATSSFGGGVNLASGCYAINGTCIGVAGSSGTVNTGAAGYFAYYPSAGTTVDDQTSLFLSSAGNIGVGTNGPTDYGAGVRTLAVDGSTTGRIDLASNGIVQGSFYNSGSTVRIGNINPNAVALITDDTQQLIIDGSGNVTIASLGSGLVKSTSGVLSNATAGTDYENPLTFNYPLVRAVNAISLAFGTTTQNFWNAYNNFSSLFATNASSTNATTTNLHITSATNGGLATDANGRVYSAATTTAGTGLTYSGNAFNVNTSQNISTLSNLTSNGLIKTSGGTGALSIATAGTDYVAGGAGAATSTVTCAGTASCTGFVAFAASPITITGTGLASYDAWLHQSTYGATASATTTPLWAQSGLYASSTVAFGTAGKDLYFNSSTGFLGLGSTSPNTKLTVWGSSAGTAISVNPSDLGIILSSFNASAAGSPEQLRISHNFSGADITNQRGSLTLQTNGNKVGIGTTSPFANLSVASAAGGTTNLFAISTSTSGFATSTAFLVDSNGKVGIGTSTLRSNTAVNIDGGNLFINNGGWAALSGLNNFQAIMPGGVYYFGKTFDSGNSGSLTYDSAGGYFTIFNNNSTLDNGVKISDNLTVTGNATTTNVFATNLLTNTFAAGQTGTTSVSSTGALTTPSLTIGSLTGLLKGTAGAVSVATAGTDYIAGGAGAATTTLSTSGVLSFSANPIVFGAAPITLSITQSNGSTDGYLSSTDWTSFNSRLSTSTYALIKDWGVTTNIFGQSSLAPTTTQNIAVPGIGTSTFAGGVEAWRSIGAPYFHATSSTATSTFAGGALIATGGGNVGIGTTSPQAKLEVKGAISASGQFKSPSSTFYFDATNGLANFTNAYFANWYGSDSVLRIVAGVGKTYFDATAGNVGIGTTTPYRTLSVQGAAGISGDLTAANVVATGTLQVSGQTTLATSLSGLLKATAGVIGNAVAGTDYIAGGAGAATTTVSCSGGTSCSGFTVFGSSPITISSTAGLTSYDAWTHPAAGQSATTSLMLFNGNASSTQLSATQAYFGGTGTTTITSTGFVGVGSSTPWARLSINPTATDGAAPAFAIGSSTATNFVVTNAGFVGVGTSAPDSPLHVSAIGQAMNIGTGANSATYITFASPRAQVGYDGSTAYLAGGSGKGAVLKANSNIVGIALNATQDVGIGGTITDSTAMTGAKMVVLSTGLVGIGTTTPRAGQLSVASSTGSQLSLFDGSATASPFNFRAINNTLYISTSSPLTFATTSSSIFALNNATGSTTLLKLDVSGSATSSFGAGINLASGCFAINGTCVGTNSGTITAIGPTGQQVTTGAALQATTTSTTNGLTSAITIVGSGNTLTYTPSLSGTLTVAGGGTGVGTFTSGQLLYGNGTNALSSVATTTFTPSAEFTTTGTLGALIGGSNSTIGLANNGVALTKLAQIAANSVLVNNTSGTANVTAIATSTFFGTGTGGQTLTWNNGAPAWVSTTTAGTGLTYNAGTPGNFSVNTSQNISTLSNLTSNGLIKTSGGTGALSIATPGTDYVAGGAGAATTTVSCSGTTSCTGFVAFGSAPITISSTAGLSSYDAWTHPGAGQSATTSLMLFNGGATSTQLTTNTLFLGNGALTTPSLAFASDPTTGFYSSGAGQFDFQVAGSLKWSSNSSAIALSNTTGGANIRAGGGSAGAPIYSFGGDTNTGMYRTAADTIGLSVGGDLALTVAPRSAVGIGTSTPINLLTLASSTVPQLTLSDGSVTASPFNFRSINNNFYLSTSSPTTFATSTASILSINTNGDATFGHALTVFPGGTTGANTLFDVGSGQFTVNPNGVAIGGDQTPDAMLEVIGGQFLLSSDSSAGNNGNRLSFDSSSGFNGIGTTSPRWALTVSSSTAPQLTLTDGSATASPFNFRAINNSLFLSTSSPTTFATTTVSFFSFNNSTGSTSALKFDVTGSATSTFGGGIFAQGGLTLGSTLNGILKATNGAITGTVAGTDYVAGGTGSSNQLAYFTGTGAIAGDAGFTIDATADRLTSTYASSTAVSATNGHFAVLRAGSAASDYSEFGNNGTSNYWSSVTDPAAIFTGGGERLSILTSGFVGVASTTPWGLLSVNPNALGSGVPEFVVGSSTATHFVVNGAGNVGIGTTSPYSKLSVVGSAVFGGNNGASISLNNGAASDAYLYFDGALHLAKNGTGDRITILDGGNAGIGSTTPWKQLSIGSSNTGTFAISTSTAGCAAFSAFGELYSTGSACGTGGSQTPWTSNINGGGFTLTNTSQIGVGTSTPWATLAVNPVAGGAANQFVVGSSTATAFVINNSGNVAIGTTTADLGFGSTFTTLTAHNPTGGGVLRASSASIQTELYSVEASGFGVAGTRTNHPFTLRTNNTEYVRITTAGSVGIGSSTPWGQLSVNPNALGSGVPEFVVGSSTATHFVIDGAGRVGIGTANPGTGTLVDISQPANGSTFGMRLVQSSANYLGISSALGAGAYNNLVGAGDNGIIFTESGIDTGNLVIGPWSASAKGIYIQGASGDVGIGTSSPWGLFSVNPNALGSGVPEFVVGSSTATRFVIDGSGKIGIGTAAPTAKLQVVNTSAGAEVVGLQLTNSSNTQNTGITIDLDSTGAGVGVRTSQIASVNSGASATNLVFRTSNGAAPAEAMRITNTGLVGVGTTTPGAKLVVSSSASEALYLDNPSGQFSVMRYLNNGAIKASTYWDNTNTKLENSISSTGTFTWVSNGSEWMRINTTGNVGVGTTTPAGKLNVYGGTLMLTSSGGSYLTQQNTGGIVFDTLARDQGIEFITSTFTNGYGFRVRGADPADGVGTQLRIDGRANSGTFTNLVTIRDQGNVGFGTSSPQWKLNAAGASAPQLTLSDASLTNAPFNFRAINNALYISTSSPTTFATTTSSVLSINSATGSTTLQKLSVTGLLSCDTVDTDSQGNFVCGTDAGGAGGSPAGSGTELQYRNGGSFGAVANSAYDGTTLTFPSLTSFGASRATTTIANNLTSAWTLATSSTLGVPLISVDTTTGSEKVTIGVPGGDVHIGIAGAVANLVFENSAAIKGTGATTLTLGTTGDIVNSAVKLAVGSTSPWAAFSIGSTTMNGTAPSFAVQNNATTSFAVFANGKVGIGTTTSAAATTSGVLLIVGNNKIPTGQAVAVFGSANATMCFVKPGSGMTCTSDGRYKKDVFTLGSALDLVSQLRPVTYHWLGEDVGDPSHTGFIAQEVQQLAPDLVSAEMNGQLTMNYGGLTPYLTSAIQDIGGALNIRGALTGTSTLKSFYAGTTTAAISVDSQGRVGIGNTSPTHTLDVYGDVAAISFVNTSTKTAKTNIAYLDASSTEDILTQIGNLRIAEYRYKMESKNNPLRLGLIAEEAPVEVLSLDGKGVDIYKLTTFTLAGVQALASHVNATEIRVDSLEDRLAALEAAGTSGGSLSLSTLTDLFHTIDIFVQKGIAQVTTLVGTRFVAAADSAGNSSAGSGTVLAGNTVVEITNPYATATSQVFITMTAPVTGNWYLSDKADGSFRVHLAEVQTADVTFDYFIVQTKGQIATSTPDYATTTPDHEVGHSTSIIIINPDGTTTTILGTSTPPSSPGTTTPPTGSGSSTPPTEPPTTPDPTPSEPPAPPADTGGTPPAP